ncbi:MAG: alpha/beta hydrolase family protein [Chloroflexota bacterium]
MFECFSRLRTFFASLRLPPRAWTGAAWGVGLLAACLWGALAWAGLAPAGGLSPALFWLSGIAFGMAFGGLILLLGWLLRRFPQRYGWAALGALPLLASAYLALPLAYGLLALLVGLILTVSLLGAALASLLCPDLLPRQRRTAIVIFIISLTALLGGGAFLLDDGYSIQPPVNAAALSAQNVAPLTLPDPSLPGKYPVRTLTYGSGSDHRPEYGAQAALLTAPVDGSQLLEGWSAIRRAWWGFGPESLPLNARVWLPGGEGAFPLILIAHGNHPMEDFSENGYDYLAELLASRGFIVALIDENFLNLSLAADFGMFAPLKDENDARAWLILEHLRQWREWSVTPGNPFYGRVKLDGIGLIGHSRGGEAVAIAAAFNRLPCHPENAALRFDYHFNIRAVVAIAPVDGQFLPGERPLPLTDVNYLVLHGSHDMDVVSFGGLRQYNRLKFLDGKPWFKASLYIYGANHGQFNRAWGRRDMLGPARQLFNLGALLPAGEQEQAAKVFISAFMEAALRDQSDYRVLFRDPRAARAWLPQTIYLSQYQDSSAIRLAGFDEDINLETASLPGVSLYGEGLTLWREQVVPLRWGDSHNSAVYLGWDTASAPGLSQFSLTLPADSLTLLPTTTLTFSLAAADESPLPEEKDPPQGVAAPLDLTLELVDRAGESVRLPLSHFSLLQPPLRVPLGKAAWMSALPLSEPIFQTFEFQLGDFTAQNPRFNPSQLSEIRFLFDRSPAGVIILDEVGFRP